MSKLQKALLKLRDGNAAHSGRSGNRPPAGEGIASGETDQHDKSTNDSDRSRVRVRAKYVKESAGANENLPDVSVHIDPDLLFEQGLRSQEPNLDAVADQFRRIKRPILNTAFGLGIPDSENANFIMLASALPKSGKSFCSFNLATSIARERDVGAVLVDADVLKPNISQAFGLADRVGLIDYLLDPAITIDDILVVTDLYGIVVIPAGQRHKEATELLASRRMKEFVEAVSRRFEARAIVVDTPPLLITSEAHVLAEHMGQIVLVIEAGESPQESISQAIGLLNRSKPINAILNKVRGTSFREYGSSGYGYGYYSRPS